jgi:aminoglycoside phosphotransferase family enzyme
MKKSDIQELVQNAVLFNQPFERDVQETHISWVVFTADFALKIKKPVKLSFLDFSTLELRKHFCEQEVILNSRFSNIYLSVVALSRKDKIWVFENGKEQILEYGVVMERQAETLRLDRLLSKNHVSIKAIAQLAHQVADFHKNAAVITTPFNLNEAKELFQDLRSVSGLLEKFNTKWSDLIEETVKFSDEFLITKQNLFASRTKAGWVKDVHGDLHSRNIFLKPEPVIFDCIEFNDSFRQIDVWYEVAFLCMDMEFYGHRELSEEFFKEYIHHSGQLLNPENRQIFTYFKMLRANVRAKVLTLQTSQGTSSSSNTENLSDPVRYLELMHAYKQELSNA